MDPLAVIYDQYRPDSRAANILLTHSRKVHDKALAVAARVAHLQPDRDFIAQAALLHDIGIKRTSAPQLGCHGPLPYVCHGIAGREILMQYNLTRHSLVCERHIGVGITPMDIRDQGLPLPLRDMAPVSLEEIIICYADKFYSKTNGDSELPLEAIVSELSRFGPQKAHRFLQWHALFSQPLRKLTIK